MRTYHVQNSAIYLRKYTTFVKDTVHRMLNSHIVAIRILSVVCRLEAHHWR